TAPIALEEDLVVPLDLDLEILRERIHDGYADAVKTAGHAVRALVELSAGMQLRQYDFGGGNLLRRVDVDRDAATAVLDRAAVFDVDRDVDAIAVTAERLVDRVVDDLEDEMVQAPLAGVADVHPRPLLNGLETLQDLDVIGAVRGRSWCDVLCHLVDLRLRWTRQGQPTALPTPPH